LRKQLSTGSHVVGLPNIELPFNPTKVDSIFIQGAATGAGFGTCEALMYTGFSASIEAAIVQSVIRAVVGIPCHSMWGYISGAFLCEAQLDGIMPACCHWEFMYAALWRSILLHGLYDCLLMVMPLFWKCPLPSDCPDVCSSYPTSVLNPTPATKDSKFVCFEQLNGMNGMANTCYLPAPGSTASDHQCYSGAYCEQVTSSPAVTQAIISFSWIIFITGLSFWLARKRGREVREKYAQAAANNSAPLA